MAYFNRSHNVQFDQATPRGAAFLDALAGTARQDQVRQFSPNWGRPTYLTVLAGHWREVPAWTVRLPTARPLAPNMIQPNPVYRASPASVALVQGLPKK